MARRRRSSFVGFLENAADAAGGVVEKAAAVPKVAAESMGLITRGQGGLERARSFAVDETSRALFGIIGFYVTSVVAGFTKEQPILSDHPVLTLLGSAGITYFIGTMLTTKDANKKAVLLGALINVGITLAKQYAGIVEQNRALSGQVSSMGGSQLGQYDNVTNFIG